jgi:hypothetical protein
MLCYRREEVRRLIDMQGTEHEEIILTGSREIRRLCNAVAVINNAKQWLPEIDIETDGAGQLTIKMKDVIIAW